jgi:activator-of-BECN1-regulated-autophagy protein 1
MPSPNSTTSRVYEEEDMMDHLQEKRTITQQLHEQRARCTVYPIRIVDEITFFAEYCSTVHYQSSFLNHLGGQDVCDAHGQRPESSTAVSTISIAFSPDAQTMASTHGDHTVKITCCHTGRCRQTLEGHPRTPWTVKYHPRHAHIVASGCLGHQVRLWDWRKNVCLQMVRLDYAIISISFHPTGQLLAIANGTRLHFWGLDPLDEDNRDEESAQETIVASSNRLTEMDQRHMLRCVHFPPDGRTIIVGGVNPSNEDPRRRARALSSGGTMSFYLRLWDFDMTVALEAQALRRAISNVSTRRDQHGCVYVTHSCISRSLEHLCRGHCCTMMEDLMYRPMERLCAHVRSIGCRKESTMPWICWCKKRRMKTCHLAMQMLLPWRWVSVCG